MKGNVFLDTNILVYLYSHSEKEKQEIAKNLVFEDDREMFISTQVLSEFTSILYKKYDYSIDIIKKAIKDFKINFSIGTVTTQTIERALELMKIYKYSYWDSLIMASALENNCTILYSEDCQHKQILEKKLKILNPFNLD